MTHHDDLDRELVTWLSDDAVRGVPDGLLDGIAAESRKRRQQPAWLVALRGESMGSGGLASGRALRLALVLGLVALAALSALLAAGMLPPLDHEGSPLAFIRDGDVYVADVDGSRAHLVVHPEGVAFATVAWSPDGRKLALDAGFDARSDAIVFDVVTGVTTSLGAHNPAWSPDGRELAVLGHTDQFYGELRILDAETFAVRAVFPSDFVGGLAWSPNGRWIAATGGGDRSNAVLRLDVATGEVVQVAPGSGHLDSSKQVSWSPDSRRIAYIRYGNNDTDPGGPQRCFDSLACIVDVFVANADGSNAVRVNSLAGQADMPRWSPDGTWVAFRDIDISRGDTPLGIHVVRPDGTDERVLVVGRMVAYVWRPQGDRLLLARSDGLTSAVLWEVSLGGVARSLDVRVDAGFFAATGLSFDLQAPGT